MLRHDQSSFTGDHVERLVEGAVRVFRERISELQQPRSCRRRATEYGFFERLPAAYEVLLEKARD